MNHDKAALNMLNDSVKRGELLDVPTLLDETAPTVKQRRAWATKVAALPRAPGKLNLTERELLARLVRLGLEICPDELTNVRTGQRWEHPRTVRRKGRIAA